MSYCLNSLIYSLVRQLLGIRKAAKPSLQLQIKSWSNSNTNNLSKPNFTLMKSMLTTLQHQIRMAVCPLKTAVGNWMKLAVHAAWCSPDFSWLHLSLRFLHL
jgi:hypothetical protein